MFPVFLIIYIAYYYYKYSKRKNPLPGPLPIPFIGNSYQPEFWKTEKEISSEFINELFSQYGDIFETYSFNERIIWVNRIDLAEKFLKVGTKNKNSISNVTTTDTISEKQEKVEIEEKLEYNYFYLRNKNEVKYLRINEIGIYYNHEYSSWKFHKNVLTKCVTLPKFLKEIVVELQEHFKEMENYWNHVESSSKESTKNEDKIIDISKWINYFTSDLFLHSVTKEKSFSMANYFYQIVEDEENKLKGLGIETIINEFNNGLWLLNQFNFNLIGFPYLKRLLPVYKFYHRKYFNGYWWFHEKLLKIVQSRRFEILKPPKEQDIKVDVLTSLINYGTKSEDERALTDDEVVFIIKDFIGQGIGTISNSFSFIIYYICKYPTVKYRMIEEIDSLLGNNHNHNQNNTFTYFILAKLHYCEAVIKEVLRMNPVHPLISRILNEKENIGGLTWDIGQMFYINLKAVHNHKFNWKNPEEFDPERFLYLEKNKEEKELNEKDVNEKNEKISIQEELRRNPLHTFGMGLRSCPAKDLSMTILKTMVVMFLRSYDVILVDKDLKLQVNYKDMLNNCEELKVKIRPRYSRNQN